MSPILRPDPKSVTGKAAQPAEDVDVIVIGAGPAGLASATKLAEAGASVVLVDENPVDMATMGDEIPLHFGQAMTGAVRNHTAVLESMVAAETAFEAALEAGVDLRLGTAAWGIYANGPSVAWLPGTLVGLVTGGETKLIRARRVVVAAGRRDMGLGFPGWELPGVVGATAALSLVHRYQAFAPRRVVVLGSSTEALAAALDLRAAGVEIAAIIEHASATVGAGDLVSSLEAGGTRILTSHVVRAAKGRDSVTSVAIVPVDAEGADAGARSDIACDGVVLAVGTPPVVDLLDAVGCRIAFSPERGGYAPVVNAEQRTSIRDIFAVGDCAGVWGAKSRDRAIAEAEGQRAAAAILADLGKADESPSSEADIAQIPVETDVSAYRLGWVKSSVVLCGQDVQVCQCEDVTAREILEVRPPRYLDWTRETRNERSLDTLLGGAPADPDQVKRLTRAGMGVCQGRRCREQTAALLAIGGGVDLKQIRLANHRAPVRPLPLSVLGQLPEHPDQADHWDSWFGMKAQWRPFWEVPAQFRIEDDANITEISE